MLVVIHDMIVSSFCFEFRSGWARNGFSMGLHGHGYDGMANQLKVP
jgi:hypothetical protein